MSLQLKIIERLFDRLTASYGREWVGKWDGVDMIMVKSMWAHELSNYSERLDAIGWALENLPSKCPNVVEFKQLCKQAPRNDVLKLDVSKADVSIVDPVIKNALNALGLPKNEQGAIDHKQWAKKLKERHERGEKLNQYQIDCYKTALELT